MAKKTLSKEFFDQLADNRPYHQLAWRAGLTPNQLYKITSGVDRPDRFDPRIPKLAHVLGMRPEDCFTEDGLGPEKVT